MNGVVGPPDGFAGEFNALHLLHEYRQQRFKLHAGDVLPDAAMDARAERQMAGRPAVYAETLRVLPFLGVQVGRAQDADDLAALGDIEAGNLVSTPAVRPNV